MAQFIRIRRTKRRPWRLGTTAISNTAAGTLVNLDDPAVKRDLLNTDTNTYQILSGLSADNQSGPFIKKGTISYGAATTDLTTPLTAAKVRFTSNMFKAGDVVSQMTVVSGAAAQTGASPHSWGSLWTSDGTTLTCVAVSPDTVGLLSANTGRAFVFGTAYTVPTDGMYVFGTLITAGTQVPTLWGANVGNVAVVNAVGAINGNETTATRSTPVAVGATVLVSDVTNDAKLPMVLWQ
jgi:hypothetical protein